MNDKLYKVKHKESGLYWKGGGMNSNNNSSSYVTTRANGKYSHTEIDYNSEEHALSVCFSKVGKTWSSLRNVKSALGHGHEVGLNSLLKKCTLMEIEIIEKEVS